MKKIIKNLKYIKIRDFFDIFIFLIVLPISFFLKIYNKIKKRKIWLITEEGKNARDNGYYFYKFIRQKHPDDYAFFVIDKNRNHYKKVYKYGNIINYRSFKHWIYYLSADLNISSQKDGNPSTVLFYVLHVCFGWFKNRVFLQHGITMNYCEWLLYKNTKFKLFLCGAKDEYKYIKDNFGYPDENVKYTGFARYDSLYNFKVNQKQILFMPSWRNWLGRKTNFLGKKLNFVDTDYFKYWNDLLNDKKLIDYIEKNNIKILFYPHINMQKYLNNFNSCSKNVKFLDLDSNIQEVLKTSALLVTDYSSISMDFAYMKKPLIYFQFDENEFRKKQYQEGYFNYHDNGFGKVTSDVETTVSNILKYLKNNHNVEKKYKERMDSFFERHDEKNCERIYSLLKTNNKILCSKRRTE